MKHLLHLIVADVRRFRLLLAVWLVVLMMDTALGTVQSALAGDERQEMAAALVGTILFLTRWLGMIVIVPLVVQTHPLVGSTAFWMTRPIPWRTLCASKIVLLGATFVAAPVASEIALMFVYGVPTSRIALVAMQMMLFHALWLLLIIGLSTVTRNLARFALVSGSILIALVLLINVSIVILMRNTFDGPQLTAVTARSTPNPTEGVIGLLLLLVTAVAQIVVQYRTRSARTSIATGVVGVAAVISTVMLWPSNARLRPVPDWALPETSLQLVVESPKGEFSQYAYSSSSGQPDGWRTGNARLRLRDVQPGWLPTVTLAEGSVQFDDGVTLTTVGNGYQSSAGFEGVDDPPLRAVARGVLGVGRLSDGFYTRSHIDAVPAIIVRQADFKKYAGATGRYRGRFLIGLDRVQIAGTIPLRSGAEFQDRWRRVVIDQVILQSPAATLRLRQFTTATIADADEFPQVSFYLRNPGTGEAVAGSQGGGFAHSFGLSWAFFFGVSTAGPGTGFNVANTFLRFPELTGVEDPAIEISADWLSRAELVIVYTLPAGSVTRSVEIPGFEIAAADPKQAR